MQEAQETQETRNAGDQLVQELCDAFRYLGDASYAILPKELAHDLADLKKSFLSSVRTLIDKDIEWVNERVAGGDRLREEWKKKWNCEDRAEAPAPEPIN